MAPAGKTPKPPRPRWQTVQRFVGRLVFDEAPRLLRHLGDVPSLQEGLRLGIDVLAYRIPGAQPAAPTGRPVTSGSVPTAHRARKLVYAPDLGGRADSGEIVWTWLADRDDPARGADRPVLVVGRDHTTLLGLALSHEHHRGDRNWVEIGAGSWDYGGGPNWVRLDRVFDVPEEGIRREGAVLERDIFDAVAARLRADHRWS